MSQTIKNHISLVVLGRQNPQILNSDFLRINSIIPLDKEPFISAYQKDKPFNEFVSTPPFTRLSFQNIDFIVDEQRLQIRQTSLDRWQESIIPKIAINYYKTLPHTPLSVVGFNFNYKLIFSSEAENRAFHELLFPNDHPVIHIIDFPCNNVGVELSFICPNSSDRIKVTIANLQNQSRIININYEFDYQSLKMFESKLDGFGTIADYCDVLSANLFKLI